MVADLARVSGGFLAAEDVGADAWATPRAATLSASVRAITFRGGGGGDVAGGVRAVTEDAFRALLNLSVEPSARVAICAKALPLLLRVARYDAAPDFGSPGRGADFGDFGRAVLANLLSDAPCRAALYRRRPASRDRRSRDLWTGTTIATDARGRHQLAEASAGVAGQRALVERKKRLGWGGAGGCDEPFRVALDDGDPLVPPRVHALLPVPKPTTGLGGPHQT
ncbi:hypothetical protein JL720_3849 [Aureococcus anophagefferens]|nr:hypothetical protein JL720_3849 [Aureococcus anophagefferens]